MEQGVADRAVDATRVAALRKAAGALLPELAELDVRAGTGVRAATPDGLPMVGRSAAPGVLLAVGARRNGWLLAPLVARMIAAYVAGDDPGPFAARLDPRRFDRQQG
jgi:glycine oxidase